MTSTNTFAQNRAACGMCAKIGDYTRIVRTNDIDNEQAQSILGEVRPVVAAADVQAAEA